MNRKQMQRQMRTGGRRGALGLSLGLAVSVGLLAGCDNLLDVELPDRVTDVAVEDPGTAQLQLNGIMGQVECGLSALHYHAAGYEDNFERVAGAYGSYSEFLAAPGGGNCDGSIASFAWYDPLSIARASAFKLYDKIQNDWAPEDVENREKILAQTALYSAIALEMFGDFFCEMALDGGELMTPDETLSEAEKWVNAALTHIAATGDFELPNGITGPADGNGIEELAYAIRARIRWADGDHTGAAADLARVPDGFTAWISREGRPQRRNKVYFFANPGSGYMLPAITASFWDDPPAGSVGDFDPEAYPGTGWPDPIPFTGYRDLGILPDGRAIVIDPFPYPVTTATSPTAVDDSRVATRMQQITAGGNTLWPVAVKYESQDDDMPLVSWRELKLIQAEIEGGQAAVNLVNELRDFHSLPRVTYGPSTPDEIENMIIEERRRELWLEGRYWLTKIRHTDKLWFPRNFGNWPVSTENLFGGVRLAMPEDEYELNPNIDLIDRGTGCSVDQAPVIIG